MNYEQLIAHVARALDHAPVEPFESPDPRADELIVTLPDASHVVITFRHVPA